MVYRCIHGQAPQYLVDCCTPVTDLATRRHLRSAVRNLLTAQHYWLRTYVHRAFWVAAECSAGSDIEFRLLQATAEDGSFSDFWCIRCIRCAIVDALYKFKTLTLALCRMMAACWLAGSRHRCWPDKGVDRHGDAADGRGARAVEDAHLSVVWFAQGAYGGCSGFTVEGAWTSTRKVR